MSKLAFSGLAALLVCLMTVGCGGQLEGSTEDNAILGNGQGPGVAQGDVSGGDGDGDCDGDGEGVPQGDGDGDCDGEGTPEGAGDGECDGDGDGVPQGDSQGECEAGYVPCACEGDGDGSQDKVKETDPEAGEAAGDQDQVEVIQYPELQVFIATGASGAESAKEGDCCCLAK